MRSDVRIDFPAFFAEKNLGFTAQRHLLGDVRNRWGFDQLDFDGDGKRDIAVWQPPGTPGAPATVGRFKVLTSSSGFTSLLTRDFGRLGDIPVPGYYDHDSKADFAVLRRGGLTTQDPFDSQFWWLWCKSSANHDCTNPGQLDWGYQYDVPLFNLEFDGNPLSREVAVYRPTTQHVYWKVAGGTAWGGINVGAIDSEVVHLHGFFDGDNKTDLAFYVPDQRWFKILDSSSGWSNATYRWFPAELVPDPLGASGAGTAAPALRHGGVAVPAEKNGLRVARVWDPYTGNWHTAWDPINDYTISSCQWGSPRDVPLGGPIDRDGDGKTDLAVFRPAGNGNGPAIFILAGSPCGTWSGLYPSGMGPKTRAWAVADMNGDGKGDFLFLDPDTNTWNPWTSQGTTWVSAGTFNLGDVGAMPL